MVDDGVGEVVDETIDEVDDKAVDDADEEAACDEDGVADNVWEESVVVLEEVVVVTASRFDGSVTVTILLESNVVEDKVLNI